MNLNRYLKPLIYSKYKILVENTINLTRNICEMQRHGMINVVCILFQDIFSLFLLFQARLWSEL